MPKRFIEEKLTIFCCQVDPSVSAVVYHVRSLYFKQQKNFAEFYKSSLLYLAFISCETLPADQKLARTFLPSLPNLEYALLSLTA